MKMKVTPAKPSNKPSRKARIVIKKIKERLRGV